MPNMEEVEAGPSSLTNSESRETRPKSPRQLQKSPANRPPISLEDVKLDASVLNRDIALLISQYLQSKFHTSIANLVDEELLGEARLEAKKEEVEDVERAILDGDYGALEGLLARPDLLKPQSQKAFLYMCYRQQFLEHIDNRESQKAFNLLQKRLKPLEHYQPYPYDFYALSYLTSASTVHDAPGFRDWGGAGVEREKLVEMWRELTEGRGVDESTKERPFVPPDRLVELLKQAAAWQVQQVTSRHGADSRSWTVPSLLRDYQVRSVPSHIRFLVQGHTANVKCVDFIGGGQLAVSGSSDTSLRIFSTLDGSIKHILQRHTSRVWDCSVSHSSNIASASGDGSVRIWSASGECRAILQGAGGDVYSVKWRPGREDQLVTASYDKILRCWDATTAKQVRTFSGHSSSTLAVAYNAGGNMLASGSKDKRIRLWDAVGGVCIHTLPAFLGEITSVEFDREDRYLLAACKDNSNRLWDLRMQRNMYRYTGHQNTSKNLVRCSFATDGSNLIVGGSEDGLVYLWDREQATGSAHESVKMPSDQAASASQSSSNSTSSSAATNTSRSTSLTIPTRSPHLSSTVSPAYYPPRTAGNSASNTARTGVTTVTPTSVLEGHGDGAVFDAKWDGERMISAGEDGHVGIWTAEHVK